MKIKKRIIQQFISYFFVGGIAAVTEWIVFYYTNFLWNCHYMMSTVIAFIIATFINWILGRLFVFKSTNLKCSYIADLIKVYFVSSIGLIINLFLMFVFVSLIRKNEMISKIVSTGIVFLWNFLIRKLWVYK